jgi:hypothetical protein
MVFWSARRSGRCEAAAEADHGAGSPARAVAGPEASMIEGETVFFGARQYVIA